MRKMFFPAEKYWFFLYLKETGVNADILSQTYFSCVYLFFYLVTLLAETTQYRMLGLSVNNGLARMWKETVVTYFTVTFRNLLQGNEKKCENSEYPIFCQKFETGPLRMRLLLENFKKIL
jgi:hypothetical protein